MARVFIDGAETGDLSLWPTTRNNPSVVSVQSGMSGNYSYIIPYNTYIQRNLPYSMSEVYLKFRYNTYNGNARRIMSLYNDGTRQIHLARDSTTGFLTIYRGSTLIATGSTAINTGVSHLIELRYLIDDSTGVIQVKLNGSTSYDINYSGDTNVSGGIVNYIRFGYDNIGSGYENTYFYLDDIGIDDSTWIGPTSICVITPSAAGNYTNFTPLSGNNYENVNSIPPSDSTYVYTNTTGTIDSYTMSALPSDVYTVDCVQIQAVAVAEGTPTPTDLALGVRVSSTDYFDSGQEVLSSASILMRILEENPNTSSAWTISDINNCELEMEAVV